jgi:glycosyltransferase involved in cell wall biosynthesis
MMIAGLRFNGVEVNLCHETLWHGIEDRVQTASGGWLKPVFWGRLIRTYWRLTRQFFRLDDYDILVVGYPGQLDVFLARILSWIKHKQMVWDVFMSIYLISVERGLHNNNKLSIRLLHFLESFALRLPDLLILDTTDYVNWFSQEYGINSDNFKLVPTGADDRVFLPITKPNNNNDRFIVLYAGSFIPNHGVRYIVDATFR